MTTNRLAKSEAQPKRSPQDWCDRGNAYLRGEIAGDKGEFIDRPRHDVEWVLVADRPTIRWKNHPLAHLREAERLKPLMERRGQPMSESDTFALNKELETLGATARYRADGSRYMVTQ